MNHLIFAILLCAVSNSNAFVFNKLTLLTQSIGNLNRSINGHYAQTRSFIQGLEKIGANFNYNPITESEVGDVVFVLKDMDALREAINLKKKKKIKLLLSWRYLCPKQMGDELLLRSPEIDAYVTNSEWRQHHYIDEQPDLANKLAICYAGVDEGFWNPNNCDQKNKKRNVIVYWKTEDLSFCEQVEELLKKYKWNPIRVRYGEYTVDEYKELLLGVHFCVFISRYESQGIALAESWSMNIPTLVWDPEEPLFLWDKVISNISSAPYLNDQVGARWRSIKELEDYLQGMEYMFKQFSPRAWILKNMTDEIAAQLLITTIENFFRALSF